jgi:signal transduction histidine kinase
MEIPGRLNILLVDDNPAKLRSYEVILAELGENLLTAGSARAALDLLLRTEIAVMLIDVCMPELDGFELANLIRQHPRFQKTSIIFVSAVQFSELDRLRGYQCGAVDFVPVPIVPELLRAKVAVFGELYRKTAELERLNADLERRVVERTRELEAAASELQAAVRQKDEFLATLAHELRNPLSPIRNAVHVLRSGSVSEPERSWGHDVIERQVQHLSRLVEDLVDLNRISRGKLELRRHRIDLGDALVAAIETTRPLLDQRRLAFRYHAPVAPVWVDGDLVRLAQVFTNLIANAAQYTPEGGRVELALDYEVGQVDVCVRDSGVGISPDRLPHVFDMFYQAHDGTSGGSHGSLGIGLTLVKRLIDLHGGVVSAFSDGVGQGSEFRVRLPVLPPDETALDLRAPELAACAQAQCRIVIADDHEDALDSCARLLRMRGHEVHIARTGPEAIEVAGRVRPDAMLLDIGMPGLDGYETARRIRSEPWGRKILLIAQTGWGRNEDRRRSSAAGFDVHLVKPISFDQLAPLLEVDRRGQA